MVEPAAPSPDTTLIERSTEIVSAYVSRNALNVVDLPKLINEVHNALVGLTSAPIAAPVQELKPAVPVKKSVTNDHIVCLEDGKHFKSLKRHLQTHHSMSPQQYREKWALPADYPMVAPSYSETRSQLAKSIGLGRKAAKPQKTRKARSQLGR